MSYPENIVFENYKGFLHKTDIPFVEKKFIEEKWNINISDYDCVYKLHGGWAGGWLFINGNEYVFFTCGSGIPIIEKRTGVFH